MDNAKLEKIKTALQKAWSAETSNSFKWDTTNPSLGQYSVTSCVVQDYMGGEVLNCVATFPDGSTGSHYLNLIDGEIVDLTRQQFPAGTTFLDAVPKPNGFPTTRDYCLSFPSTMKRYELLAKKVQSLIVV